VIVERAPAAELIPRPLALLDDTIADGRARGVWSRPTAAALVLGSGQHPPEGWRPPDGLPVVRRGTGGGAVLCDADYLMLDIALPAGDPRVLADVTESYRWLAGALVRALAGIGVDGVLPVEPAALRALDQASRDASRVACFAGLGPYELVDAERHKLVGLAQRRRKGGVLFQAAAYLGGDRAGLVDLLWLDRAGRDDLLERLAATATLGARGLELPGALGALWETF
jgi:lipoate-protein ligase A